MSGLSWAEWASLPRSNRATEHEKKRARDEELNRKAKAEYYKELIEKSLVCEEFKKGKKCWDCEHLKNCINDLEWMKKRRTEKNEVQV